MKKTKFLKINLISLICLTFLYNFTLSQELPKLPDEIKKFHSFDGTWQGDASTTMGNEVSKGTVKHVWSKIADGWGMLIDETIDIPAMGQKYLGHNILGYDIGEKMYHLYTIDNFADVHDHKGTMKDSKTMYLEENGVQPDGKAYKEKLYLEIISDSEYKISGEGYVEGNLSFRLEGDLKRVR